MFSYFYFKRIWHDATHVINWNDVQVEPEGYFLVEPDCILERREISPHNHTIGQVKVQWNNLSPKETTWELEIHMRDAYPILF